MKSVKLLAMMLAAVAFAACEEDEEITSGGNNGGNNGGVNDSTSVVVDPVSSGVLILNNGNQSATIEGDFTTVDYAAGFVAQSNLFASANERSLGMTPNRACIYGSKIYTAVTQSNTIEICAKNDFHSIKQIALAGDANLAQPRDVVGKDGYVYVSLYSGHVCKIDTMEFNIVGTVAVGSYPEEMTVAGNKLYVPNSGQGSGTTVSEIDLASFTKVRDITVPANPFKMRTDAEDNVYLLCLGSYVAPSYNQVGAAVHRLDLATGNHVKVADATMMDIPQSTNKLYVVNSPYGSSTVSYASVDLTQTPYNVVSLPVSADAPAAIAADPVNGNIVLTSYNLGDNGFASYSAPGYANIYNAAGELQKKVDTGVGPCGIYFFTEHLN